MVIPGESVTTQHRIVDCKINLKTPRRRGLLGEPKTKRWQLSEDRCLAKFKEELKLIAEKYQEMIRDCPTTAHAIRDIA